VEILDDKSLIEQYELTPAQVVDYLALMGDSSDNIPGVTGVGEKTAKELIKQFSSLDEIYKNLDKISKKGLQEKLKAGKELPTFTRTGNR